MPIVCGVQFKGTCKVYHFGLSDKEMDLLVDDFVIVETARGKEMGQVAVGAHEIGDEGVVGNLKPVLRMASSADLLSAERFRLQENAAVETCREHVARFGLPMKVVSAEYNYNGTRLTFFFTSEQRVDFRDLVRDLARVFRTRIELRQIGIRDEAKIVGGIGKCGRALCCATWLTDFSPVSIRMAKQQNLPLSPMEISGLCGRLLCCLRYENDFYQEARKQFPKQGKTVATPFGRCKVLKVNVLRETVLLLTEEGSTLEVTAQEFRGEVPLAQANSPNALGDAQRKSLDAVLPTASPGGKAASSGNSSRRRSGSRRRRKPSSGSSPQPSQASQGENSGKDDSSSSQSAPKRRSSRRRRRPRKASRSGSGDSTGGQKGGSQGSRQGGNSASSGKSTSQSRRRRRSRRSGGGQSNQPKDKSSSS